MQQEQQQRLEDPLLQQEQPAIWCQGLFRGTLVQEVQQVFPDVTWKPGELVKVPLVPPWKVLVMPVILCSVHQPSCHQSCTFKGTLTE